MHAQQKAAYLSSSHKPTAVLSKNRVSLQILNLTGMDFFRVVVFLIEIENVCMFFFTLKSAV